MCIARIFSKRLSLIAVSLIFTAVSAFSQLPTAKSLYAEMGLAWNIGNTMEAIGGPTNWGNPVPTQQLIDSAKAAGFGTIRIPCAWDGNADQTTMVINTAWMAQVKQVVDFCIKDSLFVILNIHWDGGWLENRVDSAASDPAMFDRINKKQGAYWRQIATAFRDYDRHLIFASANEPGVETVEGMAVLKAFHQTFIDTVRATGGNNGSRSLVLQGPSTNLERTNEMMTTLPIDIIADRLMVEVHYYPYQFCLMSKDETWGKMFYYWGQKYHSTTDTERNATWGEEAYADSQFNMMKVQFTDNNIPVILGEFGAMKRLTLTGANLDLHILSRRYFYEYICNSCKRHGIIPVAWDAGGKGDGTMTVFDRKTGEVYDLGLLNAMRAGWGMPKLPGDTALSHVATGDNSMKILYSSKDSLSGQAKLPVVKKDMTPYDSIIVRAFVNGETAYDSAGVTKYGFLSLGLVTMSQDWTWREASLGTVVMNDWARYTLPVGTDTTVTGALVPADPTQIDFFALQAYSLGYRGTIYIDWIAFKLKSGAYDTLYNFNETVPEDGAAGNVESVKIIATDAVEADVEWKTATKKYPFALAVAYRGVGRSSNVFNASAQRGAILATYTATQAGVAAITLRDLQGRTIAARQAPVFAGVNSLQLPLKYHGVLILDICQGNQNLSCRVVCR